MTDVKADGAINAPLQTARASYKSSVELEEGAQQQARVALADIYEFAFEAVKEAKSNEITSFRAYPVVTHTHYM